MPLADRVFEWLANAASTSLTSRLLVSRGREAREHVEWLLSYYRDPAARRRYDETHELLRRCEVVAG